MEKPLPKEIWVAWCYHGSRVSASENKTVAGDREFRVRYIPGDVADKRYHDIRFEVLRLKTAKRMAIKNIVLRKKEPQLSP